MEEFGNVTDGKPAIPAATRALDVVDPVTGLPYTTGLMSGPDDVDRDVEAAERAFAGWRETTPAQPQRTLLRLADAMEAHAEELVTVEVANSGRPLALTRSEDLSPMVGQIRFFAGAAARLLEGKWSTWPATHPDAGRTLE